MLALACSVLLPLVPKCFSETLRLAAWNLVGSGASTLSTNDIGAVAAALNKAEPEIILLQGSLDWQTCSRITEALKPNDFKVLTCSSFHDGSRQVAILATKTAYFSWAEPWRTANNLSSAGGLDFVAVQLGNRRLGFFTLAFGSAVSDEHQVDECLRQVMAQVDSVKRWVANQVGVFVMAGSFESALNAQAGAHVFQSAEAAGFLGAIPTVPASASGTQSSATPSLGAGVPFILAEPSTFPADLEVVAAPGLRHPLLTCALELDPVVAAKLRAAQAEQKGIKQPTQTVSALATTPAANSPPRAAADARSELGSATIPQTRPGFFTTLWFVGMPAGLLALAVAIWILARRTAPRRAATPALIPFSTETGRPNPSSYTIVVSPGPATGSSLPAAEQQPAPRSVVKIEGSGTTLTQSGLPPNRPPATVNRPLGAGPAFPPTTSDAPAVLHQGLLQLFNRWLKEKLVRKLIADRAELLEAQNLATHKTLQVNERLARLEIQIEEQNRAYERRIEELNAELLAAKEENRELIRARIAQVKSEMAAARARVMAQRDTRGGSGQT
jgi:hypothetical protein